MKTRTSVTENPIGSVWVPEREHVITVFEARCLFDEIRAVEFRFARKQLGKSAGIAAVLGAIWWYSRHESGMLLLLLMVILGVVPTIQQVWQLFRLSRLTPEAMAKWPASLRYQHWMTDQPAKTTIAVMVGLGVVFVGQLLAGLDTSIRFAGLNRAAVEQGEQWRAVTATLLHGNPMHILFNGMAMYYLGRPVEVLAGRRALLGVFVISMLTGAAFSLMLMPVGITSVGASGGILGLLGFLIVFGVRYRKTVPNGFTKNLAANVVFIAILGLAFRGMIDNGGHLGGLVGGLLCGAFLIPTHQHEIPMKENMLLKILGPVSVVYLLVAFAFTIFKLMPHWK